MKSLEELFREDFKMCINNKEKWGDFAFVGKDSHFYVPHSIEDNYFVFLEVVPKTDKIIYVSNISDFMFKTVIMVMEEQREVKIQIPEGYEIDKSKSTFEKIIFKKKENQLPNSWEEFAAMHKGKPCFTLLDGEVVEYTYDENLFLHSFDIYKDSLPTKELAENVLALIQLLSLRKAWIGDWEPNWTGGTLNVQYCIVKRENDYSVNDRHGLHTTLSFPTRKMAEDFLNTFSDLIEKAEDLI